MNSRGFLIFRMLIEFIIALILVIAAVDVGRIHISSHIWLDIPCRLLLAILAIPIFAHANTLRRDSLAY
jgi:hypothetical protein